MKDKYKESLKREQTSKTQSIGFKESNRME